MSADHLSTQALGANRAPDFQGVLKRQWPAIVLCALVGLLLSALYVSTSKVTYESKSTVLLLALPGEVAPGGGLQRTLDVETQATIARSTALLQTVGDRLGMTASQVKGKSRVEAAPTGDVILVSFIDANAERAAEGALTYTEEFLAQRKATADNAAKREKAILQDQIDELNGDIVALTNQINDQINLGDNADTTQLAVLTAQQNLAIRDVADTRAKMAAIDDDLTAGQVVVDPRTAVNRTGLRVGFTLAGGLFVGALAGVVVALLRDRRDDRYGSAVGLDALGVQEVGRIRYPSEVKTAGGRLDATRRAYARLLVRLNFSPAINETRSILLMAVESSTLPPTAVKAVAQALASEGPDNGLAATVLSSERGRSNETDDNAPYWSTFNDALKQANRENDIVIVTAGSFDRSVAGLAIASKVDQVVLLVSLSTQVNDLLAALEDIQSVDAHEVGVVVLTRVPSRRRW